MEPTELEKRLAALANTGRSRVEVDPDDIARLLGMVASLRSAREEGRREGFEKAEQVAAAYEPREMGYDEARGARSAANDIWTRIRAMRDGAGEVDKPHVCRQCHKPLDVADGFCSDACEAEHDREMRG